MKKIKLNSQKLQLIKEKVADLNADQMRTILGGEDGVTLAPVDNDASMAATCWVCASYPCSKQYCTVSPPEPESNIWVFTGRIC